MKNTDKSFDLTMAVEASFNPDKNNILVEIDCHTMPIPNVGSLIFNVSKKLCWTFNCL